MRALLATLLLLATACGGDDECGVASDGSYPGILLDQIVYASFTSSPNNDCTPEQGDPTSLTIQGDQLEPEATGFLVLCLPRPFAIENDVSISLDDDQLVQVIDFQGQDVDGCTLQVEDAAQASASFSGYCDDGAHEAGYVLLLDGTVSVTRTCGDEDPVTENVDVGGAAPVAAAQF